MVGFAGIVLVYQAMLTGGGEAARQARVCPGILVFLALFSLSCDNRFTSVSRVWKNPSLSMIVATMVHLQTCYNARETSCSCRA